MSITTDPASRCHDVASGASSHHIGLDIRHREPGTGERGDFSCRRHRSHSQHILHISRESESDPTLVPFIARCNAHEHTFLTGDVRASADHHFVLAEFIVVVVIELRFISKVTQRRTDDISSQAVRQFHRCHPHVFLHLGLRFVRFRNHQVILGILCRSADALLQRRRHDAQAARSMHFVLVQIRLAPHRSIHVASSHDVAVHPVPFIHMRIACIHHRHQHTGTPVARFIERFVGIHLFQRSGAILLAHDTWVHRQSWRRSHTLMICNQFHLLDKRQRLERRIAHRLAFCSHHHHRIEPTRTSQDCQSRLLNPSYILRRNLQIKRIGLNPKPRTPLQRPVAPLHRLTPRLAIQVQSVPILPRLRLHSRKQHHTYYIIYRLLFHLPFSSPSPFVLVAAMFGCLPSSPWQPSRAFSWQPSMAASSP